MKIVKNHNKIVNKSNKRKRKSVTFRTHTKKPQGSARQFTFLRRKKAKKRLNCTENDRPTKRLCMDSIQSEKVMIRKSGGSFLCEESSELCTQKSDFKDIFKDDNIRQEYSSQEPEDRLRKTSQPPSKQIFCKDFIAKDFKEAVRPEKRHLVKTSCQKSNSSSADSNFSFESCVDEPWHFNINSESTRASEESVPSLKNKCSERSKSRKIIKLSVGNRRFSIIKANIRRGRSKVNDSLENRNSNNSLMIPESAKKQSGSFSCKVSSLGNTDSSLYVDRDIPRDSSDKALPCLNDANVLVKYENLKELMKRAKPIFLEENLHKTEKAFQVCTITNSLNSLKESEKISPFQATSSTNGNVCSPSLSPLMHSTPIRSQTWTRKTARIARLSNKLTSKAASTCRKSLASSNANKTALGKSNVNLEVVKSCYVSNEHEKHQGEEIDHVKNCLGSSFNEINYKPLFTSKPRLWKSVVVENT